MPVRVTGLAEAQQRLLKIEAKVRKSILRKAVRTGGKELLKAARGQAPVDTGWLRSQLRVSVKIDTRIGTATATIRAKRTKAQARRGQKTRRQIVHLVTMGTRPHTIRGPVAIGPGVYQRVDHPGARANPFLDRALAQAGRAAIASFTRSLGTETENYVRSSMI